ncbi:MAG TPA: amidohydrolase family protein [Actinomycetota bacterium]
MSTDPEGSHRGLVIFNVADGDDRRIVIGTDGTVRAQPEGGERQVDAAGRILVPAFAEPHVHLDRAFTLGLTGGNQSGTLSEAIVRYRNAVELMTVKALEVGARRALDLLWSAGVGHVRTHTAVGGRLGFRAWEAVERAASRVPGVSVRQVIMPIDGIEQPDALPLAREAAARGAVAVGGAPWLDEDPSAATRASAELAAELGIELDLHVDETDDARVSTLSDLALAVADTGLCGRAIATHCCSMAGRPEHTARQEAETLAEAGVAVVVCPISNLALQGRRTGARGLAPLHLLRDASVRVGIGLDNIRDVIVAVGTSDPLRAAWLVALAGHLTGENDLTWLGNIIVRENRILCGLPAELAPGDNADLLLLDACSLADAVALVPSRRRVTAGMGPGP